MVSLVNELKNRYPSRLIIFDLPPLLSTDDALAFSPYVDSVLLVIEEGKTSKEDLLKVKGILENTNIIGTVLNKSDSDQQDSY
jgi:Mrp family chromosome partitioning ATPase